MFVRRSRQTMLTHLLWPASRTMDLVPTAPAGFGRRGAQRSVRDAAHPNPGTAVGVRTVSGSP